MNAIDHREIPNRCWQHKSTLTRLIARLPVVALLLSFLFASSQTLQATGNYQITPTVNLSFVPNWSSNTDDFTLSIAWGDMNGDGYLDLAIGNRDQPTKVYLNQLGVLKSVPVWSTLAAEGTNSVAWGDMNGDGYLDLALGNGNEPTRVYLNQGGMLQNIPAWSIPASAYTTFVAWGDMNGDGNLDLAVNGGVYLNQGGILQNTPTWSAPTARFTAAWGDMNGDGNLDLAVGGDVYLNQGGMLQTVPAWSVPMRHNRDYVTSIAWGDMNGDGNLDLAIDTWSEPTKVYLNQGNTLQNTPAWSLDISLGIIDEVQSFAWGDVNDDGYLDLAIGLNNGADVYLNQGGILQTTPAWSSPTNNSTATLAWGDMNGDGALDLAISSRYDHPENDWNEPTKVYLNQGWTLQTTPAWSATANNYASSVAWGDINGDSTLDLAVGGSPVKVYLNQAGTLQRTPIWVSDINDSAQSVAWGDMNGDGYLDLAVANNAEPTKVYLNHAGILQTIPGWSAPTSNFASSVVWGDMNGDGALDLAIGKGTNNPDLDERPTEVYLNQGGVLQNSPSWSVDDWTTGIAWGDMNGDGALDLAVGGNDRNRPTKVYLNQDGILERTPVWSAPPDDFTTSVAWGDMNGDGALDLAVGIDGQPSKVYLNHNGMLQNTPAWSTPTNDFTTSIAWGDVNGDGALDLAVGNWEQPIKIYLNRDGTLQSTPAWSSSATDYVQGIALGDMNGDGILDLAVGSSGPSSKVYSKLPYPHAVHTAYWRQLAGIALDLNSDSVPTWNGQFASSLAPANFYALPAIRQSGNVPITYHLFNPKRGTMSSVRAYYSLDGSFPSDRSQWQEAKPMTGTQTSDLITGPFPNVTATNTHIFTWDVLNSGFFGASDNVVVRVEALPSPKPLPNSIPGPFLYGYVSTQTFPFRVRGTQVRVLQAGNPAQPISDAIVYRLPGNQTHDAQLFTDPQGGAFKTNERGYLRGNGSLQTGDKLVALLPITHTAKYTLYHTSAAPTVTGMDTHQVNSLGVQTLTVSANNLLILYNL
ncbi:MAG: FG-GAP repeat domain-containing protein, partial [Caldilineaceae bacterium]